MPSEEEQREAQRRETVQRAHVLKDAEEDFDIAKAATTDPAERQRLMNELARFRQKHREEDILLGKRQPAGIGIQMHQIMWARWLEIADEHAKTAMAAHEAIAIGQGEMLINELRASMVATTACAATIESLYEDVKYLIEPRRRRSSASWRITDGIAFAFGLSAQDRQRLGDRLDELFDRRNETLHGYSEPEPPAAHPQGFMTGAELSRFNGPRSVRDLDLTLTVLGYAESPPVPANRWVSRWARERNSYHKLVVAPIRAASIASP